MLMQSGGHKNYIKSHKPRVLWLSLEIGLKNFSGNFALEEIFLQIFSLKYAPETYDQIYFPLSLLFSSGLLFFAVYVIYKKNYSFCRVVFIFYFSQYI